MLRSIVVAMDANGLIGVGDDLPWRRAAREDLRRFRARTYGHPVILGRRTFESIGKPLDGRLNLVLTRSTARNFSAGVAVASLDEAFAAAAVETAECFILGGGSVYREALRRDCVDRIYLTVVGGLFEVADEATYFPRPWPSVPRGWRTLEEEHWNRRENDPYDLTFRTVERVKTVEE
jgi:dihydrofolate reductase